MLKHFLGVLLIICAGSARAGESVLHYYNQRFDYSVDVPVDILVPQGEPDNGDGQKFVSEDGRASVTVFGHWRMEETEQLCDPAGQLEGEAARRIVYRFAKKGVRVVSGYRNREVYYYKTIVTDDRCLHLMIEYPVELKSWFDPITVRLATSFKK